MSKTTEYVNKRKASIYVDGQQTIIQALNENFNLHLVIRCILRSK